MYIFFWYAIVLSIFVFSVCMGYMYFYLLFHRIYQFSVDRKNDGWERHQNSVKHFLNSYFSFTHRKPHTIEKRK